MDRIESVTRWGAWLLRGRHPALAAEPTHVRMTDGSDWALRIETAPDRVSLIVASPGEEELVGEASDAWSALQHLRSQLEARGVTPCCAGARVDAWPSAMGRDMGGGWLVHLLRPGRPARACDAVELLEPAPARHVGTVAEQDAFHAEWLASLGFSKV